MSTDTLVDETDGWRDVDTLSNNVVDVLARYYDAGLNAFLVCRFCGCVVADGRVFWTSPFPGDNHRLDLAEHGYRVIRWRHIHETPDDLKAPVPGPSDYRASATPARGDTDGC